MRIYANEEYLLGNAARHLQMSTALAVMTQLICNSSRPPTAAQLAETLDVSVRYLRKQLRLLVHGELLKAHTSLPDTWVCTRPPHAVSLADLYRCLLADGPQDQGAAMAGAADGATSSADLLMMQVTMSINQLVLQHLQQFDLGRLKIAESALLFTASLRERARGRSRFSESSSQSS